MNNLAFMLSLPLIRAIGAEPVNPILAHMLRISRRTITFSSNKRQSEMISLTKNAQVGRMCLNQQKGCLGASSSDFGASISSPGPISALKEQALFPSCSFGGKQPSREE
jgi:hypothetical protein